MLLSITKWFPLMLVVLTISEIEGLFWLLGGWGSGYGYDHEYGYGGRRRYDDGYRDGKRDRERERYREWGRYGRPYTSAPILITKRATTGPPFLCQVCYGYTCKGSKLKTCISESCVTYTRKWPTGQEIKVYACGTTGICPFLQQGDSKRHDKSAIFDCKQCFDSECNSHTYKEKKTTEYANTATPGPTNPPVPL